MQPALCIEMLYPGMAPEDKIEAAAGAGFRNIEFWGWKDKDLAALARVAGELDVKIVNFSGQRSGDLIDASTHSVIVQEVDESVRVARKLGTRTLMVLSNELGEGGVVVHPCGHIPAAEKRRNIVAGLDAILSRVPEDFTFVLEPLNTIVDHRGYYLSSMSEAVSIADEVSDSRLKILCDFYHLATMGENPIEVAQRYAPYIGHVHIADYPGRHGPGSGRGPWGEVLETLQRSGYRGYVGFEFSPAGDSDASLRAVRQLWIDALHTFA